MYHIITKMLKDLEAGLPNQHVRYFIFGMPEEENISDAELTAGVICIRPVSTDVESRTTGITDEDTHTLEIILAKNTKTLFYKNNQTETGDQFLLRLMDNRDINGQLQTDTIRYIIRHNLRQYGVNQPDIRIAYNDNRIPLQAIATATMTVRQIDHVQQLIT